MDAGLLQAGGDGDACGAPADDEYLVVRVTTMVVPFWSAGPSDQLVVSPRAMALL